MAGQIDRPVTMREVCDAVCKQHGNVSFDKFRSAVSRYHQTPIKYRIIADTIVGLLRHMTSATYQEIAIAMGYKSTGSPQYAYRRFCNRDGLEQAYAQMKTRQIITKERKANEKDT